MDHARHPVHTRVHLQALEALTGLALFDLDGTLTRADTMVRFMYMLLGRPRSWAVLASTAPAIVAAKLGLVANDLPKRMALRAMLKGRTVSETLVIAERFQTEVLPGLLRPQAHDRIAWHLQQSHRVVVVTASCSLWLSAWCQRQGLELIATELVMGPDGRFTGEPATPNCKGAEKVRRIKAVLDPAMYAPIHAYGDTGADRPMLQLAQHRHWRPFR